MYYMIPLTLVSDHMLHLSQNLDYSKTTKYILNEGTTIYFTDSIKICDEHRL